MRRERTPCSAWNGRCEIIRSQVTPVHKYKICSLMPAQRGQISSKSDKITPIIGLATSVWHLEQRTRHDFPDHRYFQLRRNRQLLLLLLYVYRPCAEGIG
jgi:hypothetical protein